MLTEATSSVWDPDELIYSIKAEFPVLCRALDETRESKRKEVLEAIHQGLPTCSEADVMRLLQAHDRAMQRRPMCTPTATAETTAVPEAPAGLASSALLSLCTTCLGRYMSARDLAALLLLGDTIPCIGLTAPPIWCNRADEAHQAMPSALGARGEIEATRDRGEIEATRDRGVIEGPGAAYKAAEEVFLVLDPMRTGSIMFRQLLVAFNPPSAELRRTIVKAGLGWSSRSQRVVAQFSADDRLGSELSASERWEQDQLNKALALSLSEREETNDDDVLLKRAIEASKLQAQAQADKAAARAREEEEFKRALEASREAFARIIEYHQSATSEHRRSDS